MNHELFDVVEELLQKTLSRRIRVQKMGLRLYRLVPAAQQLSLFDTPADHQHRQLAQAIDHIRNRFGHDSVKRAA